MAVEAGISDPDSIGRKSGQYQMGRYGDKGIYEKGNCRFITREQNQLERVLNGGMIDQQTSMSKRFRIVSPSGVVYNGSNLYAFCGEHSLDQGSMAAVCRGKYKQHKGWKGCYEEVQ